VFTTFYVKQYKYTLLLTVALMVVSGVNAQERTSKLFAEISLGPSFPIGQFAERSYDDLFARDQPGMATARLATAVTLGYYIKDNAGVLLTAGYSTNKQKPAGLEEYIKRNFYVDATDVDVEAEDWKVLKIMAGGFLVTPLTEDKLNLVTKISAGICKTAVPEYSWRAYHATGPAFAGGTSEEVKLPTAFCYQISLGLQYKLNDRLHLLFDINSFNATATREAPPQQGAPAPGMPAIPDRKYKLGSVNALLGVGVSF
jgi:hypothetical protein